jgi:hypothetical protein
MAFEVPVVEVDRSKRQVAPTIAAVVVLLAVVAGVAFASGGANVPNRPAAAASPVATPSPTASAGPLTLHCVDVDRTTCARMARVAIKALPAGLPAAVEAAAWKSMLCNDTADCPPGFLAGGRPLGSVIVRFADGSPGAAVNIVDGLPGPIRRAPKAWVVYWLPAES